MVDKIDVKRSLDRYRAKQGRFDVVDVPACRYLMADGHGDPNTSADFARAVEALYPLAYGLKLTSKRLGRDYVVPPLEGLWWADDLDAFTTSRDKDRWHWTLMLLVPEWLDDELVASAVEPVPLVRCETLAEGRCVQTLHVGTFDDEADVLAEMHDAVIPDLGLVMTGRHHEIYLSDRRRVAPERMRTILRQPVVER